MSSSDRSDETEWKYEAVTELADLARDEVDRRIAKTSSSAKSTALDAVHEVIDRAEEALKRTV